MNDRSCIICGTLESEHEDIDLGNVKQVCPGQIEDIDTFEPELDYQVECWECGESLDYEHSDCKEEQ